MEQFTIRELYTLEETIAADLFEGAVSVSYTHLTLPTKLEV